MIILRQKRIVFLIVAAITLTVAGSIGVVEYQHVGTLKRSFNQEREFLVGFTHDSIQVGLANGLLDFAKSTLDKLQTHSSFQGAVIFDTEMIPILSMPEGYAIENSTLNELIQSGTFEEGLLSYGLTDLHDEDGELIGHMALTFDQSPLQRDSRRALATGIVVGIVIALPIILLIMREISKRFEVEEQLRANTENLENEVVVRKRAEKQMLLAKDEADAASKAKSQFLANMSHELRTPLNAIIGYSEILLEDMEEGGHEDLASDQNRVLAAGRHLLDLINDILDLSKIEAGKMDVFLETFNTETVILEVESTIQPLVKKNANTLEVILGPELGAMHSDLTKVRQCLFNVLSNACKFTEEGTITLDVKRQSENGRDWLIFATSDTGVGLSQEQVGRLFEVFSQADASTTRKYGGTGLGLAISQKVCEMLGGEITVESELGKGSTFFIRLPATSVEEPEEPAQVVPEGGEVSSVAARSPSTESADTVLIIDDDAGVGDLLKRMLEKEGFNGVIASSGEEGLRYARELKPFAITLDILMPGIDGWAVLTQLKADPELADIPVIIISIVEEKNLGYSLGASDYLTKPVDKEQLGRILGEYQYNQTPVLIVDDEEDARDMLRRTLTKLGKQVVEASNGRLALERIEESEPSLVLLDLMMPEMNGFEFLDELQRRYPKRMIPVIVLTGKSLTAEERRLLSGQVEDVMEKSMFSREMLLTYLRKKLGELRIKASESS